MYTYPRVSMKLSKTPEKVTWTTSSINLDGWTSVWYGAYEYER